MFKNSIANRLQSRFTITSKCPANDLSSAVNEKLSTIFKNCNSDNKAKHSTVSGKQPLMKKDKENKISYYEHLKRRGS